MCPRGWPDLAWLLLVLLAKPSIQVVLCVCVHWPIITIIRRPLITRPGPEKSSSDRLAIADTVAQGPRETLIEDCSQLIHWFGVITFAC